MIRSLELPFRQARMSSFQFQPPPARAVGSVHLPRERRFDVALMRNEMNLPESQVRSTGKSKTIPSRVRFLAAEAGTSSVRSLRQRSSFPAIDKISLPNWRCLPGGGRLPRGSRSSLRTCFLLIWLVRHDFGLRHFNTAPCDESVAEVIQKPAISRKTFLSWLCRVPVSSDVHETATKISLLGPLSECLPAISHAF